MNLCRVDAWLFEQVRHIDDPCNRPSPSKEHYPIRTLAFPLLEEPWVKSAQSHKLWWHRIYATSGNPCMPTVDKS